MYLHIVLVFSFVVYLFLKYVYSYWDRSGFPSLKPDIPFGNLTAVARKQNSFGVAITRLYEKSKGPFVGIYLFFRPAVLIRDAELAKRILTVDFNYFHDRGVHYDENDAFSKNLFATPGRKWRNLRAKLTPTFTSGQLRNMLPTVMTVGDNLLTYLQPYADKEQQVEIRAVISRYVVDIIATVFFGFEANTLFNPQHPFKTIRETVTRGFVDNFRTAAVFVCPGLLKWTGIRARNVLLERFMTNIVQQQIEHREKANERRRDFMQLLIDLRNADGTNKMSVVECASNMFLFYIAGSETSTATITYTLHELSQNVALMSEVQSEIDAGLARNGGEISYDTIKDMKLLDCCVRESLRKYPGLPILNRECTMDYRIPDSDYVIKAGTSVIIPVHGFGSDETYFPDADGYHPERFATDIKNYVEAAYIPFGEGPRNCIGIRMGILVSKIALILLLSKYRFEATQGSKVEFDVAGVGLDPKGGITLKLSNREKTINQI